MTNKYRRCFYGVSKEILEDCRSDLTKKIHFYRDIVILLYTSHIVGTIWYAWQFTNFNWELYNIRKYDIYANYFANHQLEYDPFFMIVIFLFIIFDFSCQWAYCVLPLQTPTWRWWHQIIVVNQEAYYANLIVDDKELEKVYGNKETEMRLYLQESWKNVFNLLPELAEKKLVQLLARLSVWFHLEHIDKEKFFGTPFKVIPSVSNRVRRRVLFFTLAYDILACFLQIGYTILVTSLFSFNYLIGDFSSHPWGTCLWAIFNIFVTYTVLLRIIRSAIFFIGCTLLGTIVYTGHVKEMGMAVVQLLTQLKHPRSSLKLAVHSVLFKHLQEHNLVCYLVVHGCQTLFGFVMLVFLLLHIPVNVYLIAKNVFTSPPFLTQITLWTVAFFQALAAAIVFLPLAWCCKVYHSPKKFIPKLQAAMVGRGWLVYKLKYDDLYNRMIQGPKMAVFIGNMSTPITFSSALEFLFMYIGFLLMSFSRAIEANLQKGDDKTVG